MQECKQMDRGEMVRRRRRSTDTTKPKKYFFCSKWDPRGPNINNAMRSFQTILYMDGENKKAFPQGSLITGFRKQKNIGEIIAPSKPVRSAGQEPAGGRGCYPCHAP